MPFPCRVQNFFGVAPLRLGVIVAAIVSGVIAVSYLGVSVHYFNSSSTLSDQLEILELIRKQIPQQPSMTGMGRNSADPGFNKGLDIMQMGYDEIKTQMNWQRAYAVLFLLAALAAISSIPFIAIGLIKEQANFILVWVIIYATAMGLSIVAFFALCIKGNALLILPLLAVGTGVYLLIVTYSYHLALKEGTIRAPQANGVQDEMISQPQPQKN